MKRVKFNVTFNVSIDADDTWDDDEMAELAAEGWPNEE
jgi:hypothetical protein